MSQTVTGVKTNIKLTSKDIFEKLETICLKAKDDQNGSVLPHTMLSSPDETMWTYLYIFTTEKSAIENGVATVGSSDRDFDLLGDVEEYVIFDVNRAPLITACHIEHRRFGVPGEPAYKHQVDDDVLEKVSTPFFQWFDEQE